MRWSLLQPGPEMPARFLPGDQMNGSTADAVAVLEDETALTMRDPFPEDEECVRLISVGNATPREWRRYEESNET